VAIGVGVPLAVLVLALLGVLLWKMSKNGDPELQLQAVDSQTRFEHDYPVFTAFELPANEIPVEADSQPRHWELEGSLGR